MIDSVSFLKDNTLLAGVPEALARELAGHMRTVRFGRGESIFREGERGDAAYFVVEGAVRIEKKGIQLVKLSRGECVGEFALIDDGPRSANAIAATDAVLLEWRHDDFERAISLNVEVARGIFRYLIGKLRRDVSLQVTAGLERERWQQDIRRAREIQMAMLPQQDLETEELLVAGYCRPAADVGGDYYDYVRLEDGRTGLAIADVTGHGFYAGLLVAMAKSCVHTQAGVDASPGAVIAALNWTVLHSVQSGLLMTACYARLDPARRVLAYTNAGHPYPILYHRESGELERLAATDLLLGFPGQEKAAFSVAERPWERGDVLVLFSDGVPEAASADDEEFGESRLERIVVDHRDGSARDIRGAILDAVSRHTGDKATDDVTVVVAKFR
jgi:serine phosphatase RsbU (regulator of sigma subunit)